MKRFVTNLGVLQIFCALLLVIAIMFVSSYYVYKNSISDIYDKVTQNNALSVKSIIQTFDNSFSIINNTIHSIHGLPYKVISTDSSNGIDMNDVYLMQDNIGTIVSTVDFIEEVIVFYDDVDLAIMRSGTSSLTEVFNNKYKHTIFTSDYWRTYMKADNIFKLFPGEYYRVMSSSSFQASSKKLLVAAGGNKVRLSNKNIILLIDEAAFTKHINQQMLIPGSSFIVLDQNRQEIFSTDSSLNVSKVMEDVYFNSSKEVSLTKENVEYKFYKSDFNGYIYIEVVPYQFQNLSTVAKANRLIMLTSIVCAIILSIFLSYYLNRPVKNILRELGWKQSRGNDFRKIMSGVVKMKEENESYKKQLSFVEGEALRGVFLHAVDNYSNTSEPDIQIQKYEADLFRSKQFVMVRIDLNPREGESESILPVEQLTAILQKELIDRKVDANVFYEKHLQFIVLVGIKQVSERDQLLKKLQLLLERLEKEELTDYSLYSSVSKVYTSDLTNSKRAYQSVTNAMLYRSVNSHSRIMDVQKIQYAWSMHLPLEKLEKLSNYVMNGKLKESKEIIADTFKENMDRNVHHHQFVHIAKTMFYYVLRHAGATANEKDELYRLEQQFLQIVEYENSYELIENALVEVVKHIVKNGNKSESISKLNPTFISQYIELHYMNNLYLDHIAEITETSPKYFSSYFKKTFGINYVEYLNKVRLSHARDLLNNSTLSVAEIGEKTGYLNSSTFTTTFKKYFGISPSEYRKQQKTG